MYPQKESNGSVRRPKSGSTRVLALRSAVDAQESVAGVIYIYVCLFLYIYIIISVSVSLSLSWYVTILFLHVYIYYCFLIFHPGSLTFGLFLGGIG